MKTKLLWGLSALLLVAYSMNATTINGVLAQVISGFTAHGVIIGEGASGDISVVIPGTSGLPLLSQGASSDPIYATLANAGLTNSSVTVNTSGPLTGGGSLSLGGSLTLACATCLAWAGVTNATAGATPTWVLASGDAAWTLTANATATVTVVAGDKWAHHTIQLCQDATGSRTFTWPSNVKGGMVVGTTASKCSAQTFESYDGTNLYATGTGVLSQ